MSVMGIPSPAHDLTYAVLKLKSRFAFVDAPESKQSFGKESQQMVKKMVYRKLVRVEITDVDRYGRCVGFIRRYGKNINQELVKRGGAWVYEEYIRNPSQNSNGSHCNNKQKNRKKAFGKIRMRCAQAHIENKLNKALFF